MKENLCLLPEGAILSEKRDSFKWQLIMYSEIKLTSKAKAK